MEMETETLEIWFGLAMLVALAAPAVAVALTRGSLDRKGYTIRFVTAFLLSVVATVFVSEFIFVLPLLLTFSLLTLVLHLLIVRWTAMRLNDLRITRWTALLWYMWPIGLALAILLTVKRHRDDPVLF